MKIRRQITIPPVFHLPKLSHVPMFFRETFGTYAIPREPEPDIVMDDPRAVTAFTEAGRPHGPAAAYYLFYTAHASLTIQGAKRVLDIGTGPGTQLIQLAELHPQTNFVGMDLSESMLEEARRYAAKRGVHNIEFIKGDFTRLNFPDGYFDGVTGIMALHHLPSMNMLRQTFTEIKRVLAPEGAVFFVDFGRLKSPFSMLSVAFEKRNQQDILLTRDYERSLRAAFRLEDYQALAQEYFPGTKVVSTFKIPLLVMIKSGDRVLPSSTLERIHDAADQLGAPQRKDLDEIRVFLGLGGLANDPFQHGIEIPFAYRRIAEQGAEPVQSSLNFSAGFRAWVTFGLTLRLALNNFRNSFWTDLENIGARRKIQAQKKDLNDLGRTLRKNLGALKGPLMKFGQMASYVDDRVPVEVRKLLSSLQDHSPSLPANKIRASVEKALGRSIAEAYAEWDDRPLATASISQLHLARLHNGERVVVKVLFPNIARAVQTDLRLISMLTPWLRRQLRVSNIQDLLSEMGKMILKECDLSNEAKMQNSFRGAFMDDPDLIIPRVYASHSTSEVLTMEYIEGRSFSQFVEEASPLEKSRAAEIIARVTVTSLHKHCIFNGDPHPGNYLFLENGKVAFLDFGFTRVWDKEFVNLMKMQAMSAMNKDLNTFAIVSRKMGYECASDNGYADLMRLLLEAPYQPWLEDRSFHYTRDFVRKELLSMSNFYKQHGPVRLSANHLIVHRVFWGHHAIFADLDAKFNLHRILVPLLQQSL